MPAKVIAILNQKGGAGKTTVATNLVRAMVLAGDRVLLVDSDPQGSARDWHEAGNGELANVVGLDRKTLDRDVSAVADGYDWIVIDGAPKLTELATAAIRAADVVLVPVQPSPYDIWATADLVNLIKTRQEITGGQPKAAFLISRAILRTNLSKAACHALEQYEMPILQSQTSQRVIYAESPVRGSSVLDDDPHGKAAEEIRALLAEVKGLAAAR